MPITAYGLLHKKECVTRNRQLRRERERERERERQSVKMDLNRVT